MCEVTIKNNHEFPNWGNISCQDVFLPSYFSFCSPLCQFWWRISGLLSCLAAEESSCCSFSENHQAIHWNEQQVLKRWDVYSISAMSHDLSRFHQWQPWADSYLSPFWDFQEFSLFPFFCAAVSLSFACTGMNASLTTGEAESSSPKVPRIPQLSF